jgi:hypothetical protein
MTMSDRMSPRSRGTKRQHVDDTHSFENRQRALEALKEICRELGVCAACGASAGLYLSAEAAVALGFGRGDFLELAADVWDDLVRQMSKKPCN